MREQPKNPLRGDFTRANPVDMTIDFKWENFTEADHAMWRFLFERQMKLLEGRACPEFYEGLKTLGYADFDGIPHFERMSERLYKASGWRLVVVPGFLPGEVFHAHLAKRQFPVTDFIRRPDEIDYLVEPDVFHDFFGHVPILANPVFGDYMQKFGLGGIKARETGNLEFLDTLYWYTVEFGLMRGKATENNGVTIYGAGILSSKGESIYALESPKPHRIAYDLKRVMRSAYRIDEFQETYFVIDDFQQLMDSTAPDFLPIYEELKKLPTIGLGELVEGDCKIQ